LFAGLVIATRFCGLLEASIASDAQARRLDPKVPTSVSHTYFMQGEYERALVDAHLDFGYMDSLVLTMLGREEEALSRLRRWERDLSDSHVRAWMVSIHALLEGRGKDCAQALEQLVASFRDPEGMFYVARTYARLGETERALAALARAVEGGFHCFPAFMRDPWLDPLRAQPEFQEILLQAEAARRAAVVAFLEDGGDRVLGVNVAI
jgi:hypothetical protein